MQWGKGRDEIVDLDRIARIVGQADLICLQEVERHWRHADHADQPARLAALLPRHFAVFAPAVDLHDPRSPQRRHYGLLTLSRWPILTSRGFPLPKCPVQGRLNDQACPYEVKTAPSGQGLRRYNAHLNCLF